MIPENSTINCAWGKVYYEKWHATSPRVPIIAIHGWLDNCQSFQPMAPYFNSPIFCIDLPGHGKSDNLTEGNWYHFVDYVIRLREIIQKLGLTEYILMGHSLGAAIATIYNSLFPENINTLILLDGFGPLTALPENSPQVLKKAILNREAKALKKSRPFSDLETAIKIRMAAGPLSRQAAELLTKHQISKTPTGYQWTYDPKLVFTSPLRMTELQLRSFLKELKTPTLLLVAEDGLIAQSPLLSLSDEISNLQRTNTPGGHHFHMDHPESVAKAVTIFIENTPPKAEATN
jgi:pimeloyl-ACP methyl ester carboxylesterase